MGFATVTAGVVLSFGKAPDQQAGRAGCDRRRALAGGGGAGPDKLPELPGGEQLRAFTHEPGTVVAQQKARKRTSSWRGASRAAGQLAGGRSDDNGLNADKEEPMDRDSPMTSALISLLLAAAAVNRLHSQPHRPEAAVAEQ